MTQVMHHTALPLTTTLKITCNSRNLAPNQTLGIDFLGGKVTLFHTPPNTNDSRPPRANTCRPYHRTTKPNHTSPDAAATTLGYTTTGNHAYSTNATSSGTIATTATHSYATHLVLFTNGRPNPTTDPPWSHRQTKTTPAEFCHTGQADPSTALNCNNHMGPTHLINNSMSCIHFTHSGQAVPTAVLNSHNGSTHLINNNNSNHPCTHSGQAVSIAVQNSYNGSTHHPTHIGKTVHTDALHYYNPTHHHTRQAVHTATLNHHHKNPINHINHNNVTKQYSIKYKNKQARKTCSLQEKHKNFLTGQNTSRISHQNPLTPPQLEVLAL